MATDTKNVDLLQKFIDNEKNAKTWTLISVTLFCLLAFGLIFLAWKLKTAETTISSQEKVINELLIKSDSLNDILSAQNNNWEKNYANYDSLQNITNSLLINLAELKKENPDENVISQNSSVIDKPTQAKIEKLILPSNIEKIQDKESRYTVYIQFAEGYKEQAIKLQRSWQKEYICPQPELITNRSFASTVNYFYPEDEEEARKLAKFTEVKINSPVRVNALKMKAPKKQLELWLGKYQPRTTEQIIQKYEKKSMN